MNSDMYNSVTTMVVNGKESTRGRVGDDKWIQMGRLLFRNSTDYYESTLREKWEHSIALFRSKHPPGSKYHTDQYKYRSRLFRPKSRTAVRQQEAQAAAALFATDNLVSVSSGNDNDTSQLGSNEILEDLINIRLKAKDTHWFLNVMGAYQTTMVQGACCSKQSWEYEETFDGEVIKDKPSVRLFPLENLRIDPAADWTDPVNSSSYLIALLPMTAGDIMAKMDAINPKTGEPVWRKYDLEEVVRHGISEYDDVRRARRDADSDPHHTVDGGEFDNLWVREYIVRTGGEDLIWYQLGDTLMLSDPVPVKEVYLHGRPYVIGYSIIEAFTPHPDSLIYISRDIQAKANELDNQRTDNVKLALNRRYFIRRGARIDTKALYRSVPGGSVTMNNPDTDIKVDAVQDVTASSYKEQDRVNMDFDEIMGGKAQSSLASNRQLNETVGVMQMLDATADSISDYQLRIFIETWLEPVLHQFALLEQKYETDANLLAIAAQNSKNFMRYGTDRTLDTLLEGEITTSVDVGPGATDPIGKMQKFTSGLQTAMSLPTGAARINEDAVIAELFGNLGYKDGSRFFLSMEDYEKKMAEQEPQKDVRVQVEEIREQGRQQDREIDMAKIQGNVQEVQIRSDSDLTKTQMEIGARESLAMNQLMNTLQDARQGRLEKGKIDLASKAMTERGRTNEMRLKTQMGTGI